MDKLITVLTATYNRVKLLPDLYASLCRQTYQDFDWIIIDDGSSDGTQSIVKKWLAEEHTFTISYHYIPNGGKNRAINYGVKLVQTPFTMIVDSDDYLTNDAISFYKQNLLKIIDKNYIAGIAGLRGTDINAPLNKVTYPINTFILVNNLERSKYNLQKDACEVYRTSILQDHPFVVWENEKFSPEEIVWNQLALEGYSLRWYHKVTCIVRYQENGLTKDSFNLIKKNPMGYAMMYKHRIALSKNLKDKFFNACQMIAYCILGKQFCYIFENYTNIFVILLAIPIGGILAIRRKIQFNNIIQE